MTRGSHDARRALPSVSSLLETAEVQSLIDQYPRSLVVDAVRDAIAQARDSGTVLSHSDWHARISEALDRRQARSLVGVINGTGVVLHTNLGRAPLAPAAVEAIREIASGYTNLEYDLSEGTRGSRYVHCVGLLRELTGAADAIVVNNCAAALILALSALARGREVIISRGELVEIGGSFRVPDIMGRSGATLVEVGTTNRTHVDDYLRAIGPNTGLIAKVHQSNFAQTGFVASVDVRALKSIAAEHDIPILHDLGSGLLVDLTKYGLSGEPTATAALDAGATIVLMSGDKLLGGPQCGIALGSRNAIARMRKDPFARAMRVDKLTIAALTATLELYRDEARAVREIPTLSMLTASPESVRQRCEAIASSVSQFGIQASVCKSDASVGAGAFPALAIASYAVAIAGDAQTVEKRLRAHTTPVITRVVDDEVVLDLRSVLPSQDRQLIDCIRVALG